MKPVIVGLLACALAACSSSGDLAFDPDDLASLLPPIGSEGPTDFVEPTEDLVRPDETPHNGQPSGTWSGTITVHAIQNLDESGTGDNGQDPGSVYYETYTLDKVTQADVTDTFTLTAEDPEDLTYGLAYASFSGSVQNTGSTDVREIYQYDKQNSACTWNQENGTQMAGSWSGAADADVSLEFTDDGSYTVFLSYSPIDDPTTLDSRSWLENSNISANCEEVEPGYDQTLEAGPLFTWASELYGDTTTDGGSALIEGQLGSTNAGIVAGSGSWELEHRDGVTLSIDWRFVRSGPIPLPHN